MYQKVKKIGQSFSFPKCYFTFSLLQHIGFQINTSRYIDMLCAVYHLVYLVLGRAFFSHTGLIFSAFFYGGRDSSVSAPLRMPGSRRKPVAGVLAAKAVRTDSTVRGRFRGARPL